MLQGRSHFTLGAQKLSAEGARIEAPKLPRRVGIGEGVSPPQPTRGSGERRELPQRGPGRSPGRQRIFGIFEVHRTLLVEKTVPTKPAFFRKKSTQSTIGGACPLPASEYAPALLFGIDGVYAMADVIVGALRSTVMQYDSDKRCFD